MNQTTRQNTFRLTAVPQTLPYHPTPPVFCACLGDRVFIFARHETNEVVAVTAIDRSGKMTSHAPLPVPFVGGMASCKNGLHILGSRGASLYDLRLDHEGRVVDERTLPVGQDSLLMPQIACGLPIATCFWINAQGQLTVQQGDELFAHPLPDITLELTSTTAPDGLTFLRAAGIPGYLELLRFADGRVQHVQPIAGSEQGYCPLLFWRQDHYLVVWVSRPSRAIVTQKLAADFSPVGGVQRLMTVDNPATIRWLRCLAANENDIIIAWQTEEPGDELNRQGAPLPILNQSIALFDPESQELSGVTAVNYTADSYFTGCQWGERLMVVLGGGQATVLTYQVN